MSASIPFFLSAFNANSFAIAILVLFFFFSFPSSFLEGMLKVFLVTFWHSLTRNRVTKIGSISLDKSRKVSITNVFKMLFAMRVTRVTPCVLFTITRIHSIQKILKIRNLETRWKMTQKIQLFKAQKTEKSS